jgi:hypothetical protein
MRKRARAGQTLPVYKRAIGRSKVLNGKPAPALRQPAVMAAYLRIVDHNIVRDITPNGQNTFVQIINLIGLRATPHNQSEAAAILLHETRLLKRRKIRRLGV